MDGPNYRPLTIREYARGMSFPERFVWPKVSRADAVRGIGNAVPPRMARAMVAAVAERASVNVAARGAA